VNNIYSFKRKIEMQLLKSLVKFNFFSPGETNHSWTEKKSPKGSRKSENSNLTIIARADFALSPSQRQRKPSINENRHLS
jgi:hypothetical protein